MKARLLVAAVALAGLVGACGIPEDSEPRAIEPATPTPPREEPTPPAEATQAFPIYLTDAENRVRKVERELPARLTITALVDELGEVPTDEETAQGLFTVIPPETSFFAEPITDDTGLAILDLNAGSFDTLEGEQRTVALAQLVWTLTESPSITRIIIRIEGIEERWPTDGDDRSVLRRSDYASFDPAFVEPTPEPVEDEPPSEGATPSPESEGDGG